MKLKSRHCLCAALLLLGGLLVKTGWTQTVEDSIQVPGAWVGSLAYNSREDVLYGGCQTAGFFFAISCDSNKVVCTLPLRWPRFLAYDSVDNKGYVAYSGSAEDSLAVIDGVSHQVEKRLEMPGATMPVWDPVSDRVYVSCQSTNKVAVVDCRTDSLLAYIPVGACPIKPHINTLRRKLYVQNGDDGTITIVNLATNQVIKTLSVGGNPNAGYYSRQVDKYYCAGRPGYVTVIGGSSDSVLALVPVAPYSDVFSAAENEQASLVMFGVYTGSCYVYTVDVRTDSVAASLQVAGLPYGLLYSQMTDKFYCGNDCFGSVSVITGDGARTIKTLPMGDDPFVFASVPRHNRIYVGDLGRRWVYVIRDTLDGISENGAITALTASVVRVSPSPFRRGVTITGDIGNRPLRIYSPAGELVRAVATTRAGGRQSCAVWDGLDGIGQPVPDGVYLIEAAGVRVKVVKAR